ncbi:hypothetical protein K1I93_09595, partial [Streptococcus australis]|nr:hypothetical protein [Streptococcus australis]
MGDKNLEVLSNHNIKEEYKNEEISSSHESEKKYERKYNYEKEHKYKDKDKNINVYTNTNTNIDIDIYNKEPPYHQYQDIHPYNYNKKYLLNSFFYLLNYYKQIIKLEQFTHNEIVGDIIKLKDDQDNID